MSAADVERVLQVLRTGASVVADAIGTSEERRTRQAERAYRIAVARYERTRERDRARVWWAGTGTVVCTAAALPTAGLSLVGTAVFGWMTASSAVRLRTRTPPEPPPPRLPARAPRIPRAAIGAGEVERLARSHRRLGEVLPAVERLHPAAGAELRAAMLESAPLMHQQAQRLAVLHAVRTDLAETAAGTAAEAAAGEVAARLGRGVTAYEDLLAAAVTLLGAPDPARSVDVLVDTVLGPAIEGMQAYTHGLTVADGPLMGDRSGSAFSQRSHQG